jgi:hypothetical protein
VLIAVRHSTLPAAAPPGVLGAWREGDGRHVWVLQGFGRLIISGDDPPTFATWEMRGGDLWLKAPGRSAAAAAARFEASISVLVRRSGGEAHRPRRVEE